VLAFAADVSGPVRQDRAMTLADIRQHFAYNKWANERTLEGIGTLTAEQVTRNLGSSFPSIRDTAAHIASAEWIWLRRWKGESPVSHPVWAKHAPMDVVSAKFTEVEVERSAWLSTLSDADMDRMLAFRLLNGQEDTQRLSAQLLHLVNHSTYHRGQIAGMTRQVGATPVSTDLIVYRRTLATAK
jgi:uncharacterized damage-inducible protein DinB